MKLLKVLNSSVEEPKGYKTRLTVKAVILDDKKRVLLTDGLLVGGGVEQDEVLEVALKRECIEEAGILVDSFEPLGVVVQYRDALKKRYEIHGFRVRFREKIGEPTTTQEREVGRSLSWFSLPEAETMLKERIEEIERVGNLDSKTDTYQSLLFNTMTSLIFLQEVKLH